MPTTVRVLLLSDTHGRIHAQILGLTGQCDAIVHAGDIGHPTTSALQDPPILDVV